MNQTAKAHLTRRGDNSDYRPNSQSCFLVVLGGKTTCHSFAFCSVSYMLMPAQDCTKNRIEELSEAVPETLKNVLLVMASRGVLTRDWKVGSLASLPVPILPPVCNF